MLLVRVQELSAVGPARKTHILYRHTTGAQVLWRDLGRVAYLVDGGALPAGAYHTLSVRLARRATLLYPDGRQVTRPLAALNLPARLRIDGMVWVENGSATPLRVGPLVTDRQQAPRRPWAGDDD